MKKMELADKSLLRVCQLEAKRDEAFTRTSCLNELYHRQRRILVEHGINPDNVADWSDPDLAKNCEEVSCLMYFDAKTALCNAIAEYERANERFQKAQADHDHLLAELAKLPIN